MVLPQWGHFSFLMRGLQWCCLSEALLGTNLTDILHLCWVLSTGQSIACSMCRIYTSILANMASSWASVKVLLQPIVVDLILKEKKSGFFSPYLQIYRSIDIPSWGKKKKLTYVKLKDVSYFFRTVEINRFKHIFVSSSNIFDQI